ncbi:MAG TPA: aldehyde dehydrogenase family protein, partial [Dehalococcoidia bacterium]|nr:aldehyde dehydrogenase family protein [Dehalococcoidia bacterium]
MTTETAKPAAVAGKDYQLLINGDWSPGSSGQKLERRYPANQDVVVATFPSASEEDVDRAIQAARTAFDNGSWSKAPAAQRAQVLRNVAQMIRDQQDELARLLASEVGKPLSEATMEVAMNALVFDY